MEGTQAIPHSVSMCDQPLKYDQVGNINCNAATNFFFKYLNEFPAISNSSNYLDKR